MNDTVRKRIRQTATMVVALLVVLSVSGPVGTIAAQEVTTLEQSESEVTAAPGETVELTTTFGVEDLNGQGLEVMLPTGWVGNITDSDGGAPNSEDGGNVLQVVWLESGTYEVTYEIHVSEDAAEGDYVVDVEGSGITPADGDRIVESTQTTITVQEPAENVPPTASFTYAPDSPEAGQQVSFDASASSDADGSIGSYEWDFDGDGTTDATGEQVTNTFEEAGDYDVTLTVTDDDGATDDATQTVSVSEAPPENQDPTAAFTVDPASPEVAEDATYDGSNSEDPDGTIASYEWDFDGDGTTDATGETVTHAFDAAGDYDVTLTVEDDDGATDSVTQTVTVSEPVPDPSGPSTAVSISPEEAEIVVGDTEAFDVVVEDADGGVGAFTATVSVDDPSVATIVDVTIGDDPQLSNVEYAEDNSSVTINAALMNTDDAGDLTIATVDVQGESEAETDLTVDVDALGTEDGQSYEITGTSGASVSVIELGPVGDFSEPPNDLDGDGLYEDVNGDGEFNIVDVQALFVNIDDETIQNNPEKFDFNGDGKFDVVDVQALYNELIT